MSKGAVFGAQPGVAEFPSADTLSAMRIASPRTYNNGIRQRLKKQGFSTDQFVEEVDPKLVIEAQTVVICPRCHRAITDGYDLDHIIPLAMGGLHHPSNVQALHVECHRKKSMEERGKIEQYKNQVTSTAEMTRLELRQEFESMLTTFGS